MPTFAGKQFNSEVYAKYVDRDDIVRNDPKTEILSSNAVSECQIAEQAINAGSGLSYVVVPFNGTTHMDYILNDGETDITAEEAGTFSCGKAIFTPSKGWKERDFANLIGSANFFERMAVDHRHWEDNMKVMCALAIAKGIFLMDTTSGSDIQKAANANFIKSHTYDIAKSSSPNVDVTTLTDAVTKACGEHAELFTVCFMHSTVANNLFKQKLLNFLKYTDEKGVERSTNIAEWNGRTVYVTDSVPNKYVAAASAVTEVLGVKTITIAGTPAVGDIITVNSKRYSIVNTKHTEFELEIGSGTATAIATALEKALKADDEFSSMYTISRDAAVITVTEIKGGYGFISATANGGTTVTVAETKAGVEGVAAYSAHREYTTFVLGHGIIELSNAQPPNKRYVPDYDPKKDGGTNYLYGWMKIVFGADGISFRNQNKKTYDLTDISKEGAWEIPVSTNGLPVNLKRLPIVQIISQG